jgi:hypothetical protein
MSTTSSGFELHVMRHIFPSWALAIPYAFQETHETDGDYWHAWDEHRSVSLSSIRCMDGRRPVTARELIERFTREEAVPDATGPTIDPPRGIVGWGVEIDTPPDSRASRAITGFLAVDGCVAIVTITSDDLRWARMVWDSVTPVGAGAPEGSWVPPRAGSSQPPLPRRERRRRERAAARLA